MQQMVELIRCATLAPSGHNTQPWKFSLKGDCIRIVPDFTRRLLVVDPDNRELYVSLGCALENLVIAAKCAGYDPEVEYFPAGEPDECISVTHCTHTRNAQPERPPPHQSGCRVEPIAHLFLG